MEVGGDRSSTPAQVGRLLRPRSVAIVGASPDRGSIGANALENLLLAGYQGDIYLVSRSRKEINGRLCVPSIDDLPLGIDAVVLVVPEAVVVDSVAACARRQAGSAVVFASGFAETGGEGKAKQDRLAAIALESGLMLLGPNCIGFRNFADGVALTFEPVTEPVPTHKAGAAVIAQSGAMTSNLRLALLAKGVPITCAISTGNEANLGVEDFLADCLDRPGNRLFALFIEQVRRPALFLELVRRARHEGKPIVLLHPGRTASARETAKSHTGAFAGDYQVMRAVLQHEGVVLVDTMDELFDVTTLLARWPEPSPLPVGAISNSGAFRGIAHDFCSDLGLPLANLTAETKAKLEAMLPAYATIDNPLDITTVGLANPRIFGDTAQAVLDDSRCRRRGARFHSGGAGISNGALPLAAARDRALAEAGRVLDVWRRDRAGRRIPAHFARAQPAALPFARSRIARDGACECLWPYAHAKCKCVSQAWRSRSVSPSAGRSWNIALKTIFGRSVLRYPKAVWPKPSTRPARSRRTSAIPSC